LVEGQVHPKYKIEEKSAKRSPTDRFEIFALVPIDGDPALPSFVARWDEPAMMVDIDMRCGDQTRKDFDGHHTERRNWGEALTFPILIKLPDGEFPQLTERIIFEGSIDLAEVSLRLHAESSAKATEIAFVTVTPPRSGD